MHQLITSPFFAAALGWLFWNIGKFSLDKDAYDDAGQDFPFKKYVLTHYDNWLWSLMCIPILLYLGYKQLGFGDFGLVDHAKWSDPYYLCSGFVTELCKDRYKKWRRSQKKEDDEQSK